MKTVLLLLLASVSISLAQGIQYVPGYFRHDGTYVPGHYQTVPNGNPWDNWSTRGNYNPYTGKPGTYIPHPHYDANGVYHPY